MSDSELHSYLKDIGRYPILTKEAQLLHCKRIHAWIDWPSGRDTAPKRVRRIGKRSMDIMVTTNLRLVVSIAKKFQHRGLDLLDLIQEGNLGLIRGLELFDPTRGYSVSTYVYWWIRQGITRSIQTSARTIRLPVQVSEAYKKAQRFINEYTVNHGEAPTPEQTADYLSITLPKLTKLFNAVAASTCTSLDSHHPQSGTPYVELIACPRQNPEKYIQHLEAKESVHNLLEDLDQDMRLVLERTVLDSHQIKEVSRDLDSTPSKIRKLQQEGIRQIAPQLTA